VGARFGSRDAPVHLADVVTGLVVARLGVVDAASTQPRSVHRATAADDALARGALEAICRKTHRDQLGEINADAFVGES
jgi:hypothetical protein